MSLVVASVADAVGYLRLARPQKRNALSHALVDEALSAIDRFVQDGIAVAVLEAEPPIFCAGNDLLEARADPDDPATDRLLRALLERPVFWVAVLRGPALGAGAAVAAACPLALAGDETWIALPEREIGLFPAGVLTYLEPLIGARRALELGLSGERIAASDAARAGLLSEAVPADELDDRLATWLRRLTSQPQVTDGARAAWQARFATASAHERAEQLQRVLDGQELSAPESAGSADDEGAA